MANTDTDIPSKIEDFSSFASEPTYKASNDSVNEAEKANQTSEIPVSIFNQGLSGLEAITFYLKEHRGLRFCAIASLLNRDDRTIWDSYTEGKKKAAAFSPSSESLFIPLSIFQNRSFGVLEAISKHLKEQHALKFSQIAQLLGKNDRTIWTAYHRASKKVKEVHHAG
jgi:predicted DNA-binding protein (UPF0251 family)